MAQYPSRLLELVAVMDRLRSPGGCPWDAEQTHESLLKYLIEEAYETVDAVESGDRDSLREELGDVLLQVVFHSRIAQEDPHQPWGIEDVAGGIVDKLIARHPHVFGDETLESAQDVEAAWQARKAAEKGRTSALDGIPRSLPALQWTDAMVSRARRAEVGVAPVSREVADVVQGLLADHELAEVLLAVVAEADRRDLDPEAALRRAGLEFAARVREAEGSEGTA